jgi:hypothetical protein
MVAIRPMLKEVHVALILLLVVLEASAAGGRMLGLATAAIVRSKAARREIGAG